MIEGNKRKKIQKATQKKGKDVLLIYMPIGDLLLPSIGLSLLNQPFHRLAYLQRYYTLTFDLRN